MSDELAKLNDALVESVTAQKLIEEKLKKAKEELATWRKRLESAKASNQADLVAQVEDRIRQLELTNAEFETDLMAQNDIEADLKKAIFRIEHGVPMPPPPNLPDFDESDATIERMENKIFEAEAFNELSDKSRAERKAEEDLKNLSLDDELEKLKQSMKKSDQK
jgi:phage shock protein A